MDLDSLKDKIAEGVQHASDRNQLHAAYERALSAQQTIRDELRDLARRTMEQPKWGIDYVSFMGSNPWTHSGYVVFHEGHPVTTEPVSSKANAIVAAYLMFCGLDEATARQGAEV